MHTLVCDKIRDYLLRYINGTLVFAYLQSYSTSGNFPKNIVLVMTACYIEISFACPVNHINGAGSYQKYTTCRSQDHLWMMDSKPSKILKRSQYSLNSVWSQFDSDINACFNGECGGVALDGVIRAQCTFCKNDPQFGISCGFGESFFLSFGEFLTR